MNKAFGLILLVLAMGSHVVAQDATLLPPFQTFVRYDDGQRFTIDSLPTGKGKYVFIFYDPGCSHCQKLGKAIDTDWASWSEDTDFYFVSMTTKEDVEAYRQTHVTGLSANERVTFLFDQQGEFITLFDPQKFPATYIYDKETKHLLDRYEGKDNTADMERHLKK